ncbi:MAG: mechanosensitive ion channel domain-containing protein, partial [Phycisphaerales bacterium JB038]
AEAESQTALLEEMARGAPDRLRQIESERTAAQQAPAPTVPADLTVEELAGRLEAARTQLEAARKLSVDVEAEYQARDVRRGLIPEEVAAAQQRLEVVNQLLAAAADPNEAAELAAAKRGNLLAERASLQATLARLDAEARSYESRRSLIGARRDQAKDRVTAAERLAAALQERLDALRAAGGEQALREAEEASQAALDAHPVVQELLAENAAYAEELAQVLARIQQDNAKRPGVTQLNDRWSTSFANVRRQVEEVGLNEVVGLRLRNQLSQLPDLREEESRLSELRQEIRRIQSRRFELELVDLSDPAAQATRLLRESKEPFAGRSPDDVLEAAAEALSKQRIYVSDLQQAYDEYFDPTLLELRREQESLVSLVRSYISFINEHILWIQSAPSLRLEAISRSWDGLRWLLDPNSWLTATAATWESVRRRPLGTLVGMLLSLALLGLRRRARRALEGLSTQLHRASTDRFGLTLQACAWTAVLALAWPALLWTVGQGFLQARIESPFAGAVGAGLERVAVLLLAAALLRAVCQPNGLGAAHFRWKASALALVRRHLRWLIPVSLPLAFVLRAAQTGGAEAHYDGLGRLAFIAAMVALAVFVQRVLRPGAAVMQTLLAKRREGWLDRLRYVWFPGLLAAPLALALTSALGYFYAAMELEKRMLTTTSLVLGVIVVHALLLRSLLVAQRRMALEQALQRRAEARAQAEAAAKAGDGEGGAPGASAEIPLEQIEVDVAAISAQTRNLLRTLAWLAGFIGLVVIWADVLPAFGILRKVELWSEATTVRTVVDELGLETQQVIEGTAVTLSDLALSLVILAITMVVTRNIAGVLEIMLLQRLPFTPGGRYAVSTLVRYAVLVVGLVLAFNAIGVGWSKVQWLVAAITVGLGFGLQEIFANFVSGIIILTEQPVRVGDTVTVGEVNGTVSRIRMRATTITDWDRKELIIPNKAFVTGDIINWSLSDNILRVRIPVGIAYGSDTAKARELLLQAAAEHPNVLAEPAPRALFLGFGESSLDFELRVFIPHIDHFISIRDDLHEAVDRLFREAGVEIAFPQRDLHVRSIDAPVRTSVEPVRKEEGESD